MKKGRVSIIVIFTFLFLIPFANAIPIYECSVLNQPGETYILFSNILKNDSSVCFDITANNIILDCNGKIVEGIFKSDSKGIRIYRSSSQNTNVTIKNCILSKWYFGIYLYFANNNTLINNTATSSHVGGFSLSSSSNNTLINNTANSNEEGFYLYNSSFNTLINNTANSNEEGFYLYSSSNNTLINNTATYNSRNGFYLYYYCSSNTLINNTANSNRKGFYLLSYSSFNTLINNIANYNSLYGFHLSIYSHFNKISSNIIQNNFVGIYIRDSNNSLIYNNLFNNTNNYDIYFNTYNYWNTNKQLGQRIYSPGIYIGGNYWTNSSGNGYSDICDDTNCDGFCDSYNLDSHNIDYLPLSNKYDYSPPSFSSSSSSNRYAGYPVNFSIKWTDDCAGLSYYEFLFDNCTGNLVKVKEGPLSGISAWVNLTLEINSTVGCRIRWCTRVKDNNMNWNNITCYFPFSFYTLLPPFSAEVNLSSPPSYFEIASGKPFLVNTSIICRGYRAQCLNISATVRYNKTSSKPNNPINETDGANPFYIMKSKLWPFNYSCVSNCFKNPDEDLDDDLIFFLQLGGITAGIADFEYTTASSNLMLYVFAELEPMDSSYDGYVQIFNFSSNSWYNWLHNDFQNLRYYNISINKSSGLIKDGKLRLRFYAEKNSFISVYNTYVEYQSSVLECKDLKENESCNLTWQINTTEDYYRAWSIDILFNISTTTNDTSDSLIKILPGIMTVWLSSSNTINVPRYSSFKVSANINCIEGNCGSVSGVLKYNKTSLFPDTIISSSPEAEPFYNISYSNNCLSLTAGQSCKITWEVNATGEKYTNWKIGISIFSNLIMGEFITDNISVSIFPQACSSLPYIKDGKLRIKVECDGNYYSFAKSKEEFSLSYPIKVEFNIFNVSTTIKNLMVGLGNENLDSYGRPKNSFVFEFNETHVRFLQYNSYLANEIGSKSISLPNYFAIEINSSNITFIVGSEKFVFPVSFLPNSCYFFVNAYNSKDTVADIDNLRIRKNMLPEPAIYLGEEEFLKVKRLGLASEKQNLISLEKIYRLKQICDQGGYESLKTNFGLEAEFYLVIRRINDVTPLLDCGFSSKKEPFALIERIVALDDGSYAKLELRVWK